MVHCRTVSAMQVDMETVLKSYPNDLQDASGITLPSQWRINSSLKPDMSTYVAPFMGPPVILLTTGIGCTRNPPVKNVRNQITRISKKLYSVDTVQFEKTQQ